MPRQPKTKKAAGETSSHTDGRPDPFSAWKWTFLTPVLAVVAVFVVTVFDPFEFESVTKRQSAIIFYKIFATLYPVKNRDEISVVLLDDETLKSRPDEPWPPSHLLHGDILEAILSYHPAAVLVDIFFLQSSGNDHFSRTEDVIKRYNSTGQEVPLFFVAADLLPQMRPARTEILKLADEKRLELVSARIDGEPTEAPLYPLHKGAGEYEPAALAIYQWVCADAEHPRLKNAKCGNVPIHDHEEMEVVWGLEPAPFNCKRAANSVDSRLRHICDDLISSPFGRPFQLLWEALIPRDWRPTDPLAIPYHAEISAKDLLDGGKRAQLEPLVAGKVVVYGARLALVKDPVFSPVHGNIDGVFMHAQEWRVLFPFFAVLA